MGGVVGGGFCLTNDFVFWAEDFCLFYFTSLASGVSGGEKEMGAGMYSIVITLLIFLVLAISFAKSQRL